MKTAKLLALLAAAAISATSAHAQTYQWKDSSGRTVISDTPPPGSAKDRQTLGGQPAVVTTPAEKAAEAPKTTADKDMEFKKRQQEAKDKADKDAREQAATAQKKENCERTRRNLSALESGRPLSQPDENGQPRLMDTTQREQEIERARKFMSDACK